MIEERRMFKSFVTGRYTISLSHIIAFDMPQPGLAKGEWVYRIYLSSGSELWPKFPNEAEAKLSYENLKLQLGIYDHKHSREEL
jgi:hypothetical protein